MHRVFFWDAFADEVEKLAASPAALRVAAEQAAAAAKRGKPSFFERIFPNDSPAARRSLDEQAVAKKRPSIGKQAAPRVLTDPFAVTARRALSGVSGEGGVVTPGGSTSRSGLPPAKGKHIAVDSSGDVSYVPTPTGKAQRGRVPPFMEPGAPNPMKAFGDAVAGAARKIRPGEAQAKTR